MRDRDGLLRHIGHAEEWLRWARSDCRRGDLRGVVLRLLLAEAEIQHAREVGAGVAGGSGACAHRRRRVPLALLGALGAAAAVLAIMGYAALQSVEHPVPVAGEPPSQAVRQTPEASAPRGVVQLETGNFLTLVPSSSGTDQAPLMGAPDAGAARVPGKGFVDDLTSRFGLVTPAPAGGPAAGLGAPGDPGNPSVTF